MSLGGLHSDTWKASVSTEESSPCHDHTYSIFFHNRNPPPTKKGSLSETTFNTESHGKISSWLCVGSYPGILWSDSMWNPCICLMKCYNALKCCAFWEFQTIQTTLLGLHWQPTPDFNYQINITKVFRQHQALWQKLWKKPKNSFGTHACNYLLGKIINLKSPPGLMVDKVALK